MRIVMNMKQDGSFEFFSDEACDVYIVNDHCPGDRVYLLGEAHRVGQNLVDEQLRDDPVGHSGDVRHAAIKHRILSSDAGNRHLEAVVKIYGPQELLAGPGVDEWNSQKDV